MVHDGGRAGGVVTAAGRGDDDLLALGEAFRTIFGVAERLAGDGDAVDPGFQLARDAKVVHRGTDDDRVGRQEFFEHVAAKLDVGGKVGIHACEIGGSHDLGAGQMRERAGGEVTIGYGGIRAVSLDLSGECRRQATGNRVIAEDTRVDMKNVHGNTFVFALRCSTYEGKTIDR
ncbi:hypothetical protein D9M70_535610 [compost metagenome]